MSPRNRQKNGWNRLGIAAVLAVLVMLVSFATVDIVLNRFPGAGAQGIDLMRELLGDKTAAQVESAVFRAEDVFHQWRYQISGKPPRAPWSATTDRPGPDANQNARRGFGLLVSNLLNRQGTQSEPSSSWKIPTILPMGTVAGEGQWSPYLYNRSGEVIAQRGFLQPDPQRPYALVAVVAFDLSKTRLHFVPGFDEPKSSVPADRPGTILAADIAPGVLVAAFNGGFKAQHGHFGAMSAGVVLIPPRPGLGTVGIYNDGKVQIGAWGTEIQPSDKLIAWRQNGPLIIHDGVVNPHTADNAPQDWGYTVAGSITTSRSALGISQDGRTLFYAAGTDLTLPALARALQAAGAYQAIQLDINNYYVHFEAIHFKGTTPQAELLLESMQGSGDQRYLKPDPRDFFYITALG